MRFLKKSLVARLVSYFLFLSLLSLILVGYLAFIQAREALKQSVLDRLDAAATLKEDQLSHWVDDQRQEVQFIASLPEVRARAEALLSDKKSEPQHLLAYSALSEYLALVAANKSVFKEIFILTDVGGKVIVSTDQNHEGEYRVKDLYYIEGRLGTFVQNVYPSPVTFNPTMTVATPLFNRTGDQLGVLAAHLNLEQMDQIILERTGLGESGETYLVDRFNVFTSGERFGRQKFPRGVHTEGIDKALRGLKGSELYLNYEDMPVIGVYRWLDNLDLALLAEMHQQEAFAPARQLALTIFLVGLALAGLLAAGVYLLARRIARPIIAITDAAIQVASGDLTPTAPVFTEDEIGVLAVTFNKMTGQLRDLYRSLEEKVKALHTAKEALQRSEEHFRSLIENASDIIIILNRDGVIGYASPSIERMLGYRPEEVIGKKTSDFLHPDDRQSFDRAFILGRESQGVSQSMEYRFRKKDNSWRYLEAIGNNLLDDSVVEGFVVNCRDITERRHAEEEIRKLNAELERRVEKRTQQLKAAQEELLEKAHKAGRADIATGVLHNVGNILNSVNTSAAVITETLENSKLDGFARANRLLKNNLETLEDFIANNPKGKKLIQYYFKLEELLQQDHSRLMKNTSRLKEKISAINDVITAQQSYAKASFFSEKHSLSEIVEDAINLQASSISRHDIQLKKIFAELPKVSVQKTKLIHILLNLYKNAKEAMADFGPSERKLTVEINNDDTNAYIRVSDTGSGIKKEHLEKIFTHGFTTKKNGHGFGLHSCANYMTEMGGTMGVESGGVDKGATFVLSFPLNSSDSKHELTDEVATVGEVVEVPGAELSKPAAP